MDTKGDCTIQIKIQEDQGEFHKQQCSPHEVMSQFISYIGSNCRSRRPEVFCKKGVLITGKHLQENPCARVSFLKL